MKQCTITIMMTSGPVEITFHEGQKVAFYPVIRKKNKMISVFNKRNEVISFNLQKNMSDLSAELVHEMMYADGANYIYVAIDETESMWLELSAIKGIRVKLS